MYPSAAPWTAPCGLTDSSSLFQGQQGTQRSMAAARVRAQRRSGQMGQQMGKEAKPRLICSIENPESGHTQRQEGGRHWEVQYDTPRQRYKKKGNDRRGWPLFSVNILTSSSRHNHIYRFPTEPSPRGLELICALPPFYVTWELLFFFFKHILKMKGKKTLLGWLYVLKWMNISPSLVD